MDIPRTLSEFQIALSKAILTEHSQGFLGYSDVQTLIKATSDQRHVEAAMRWQRENREGLAAVGQTARRAQEDGDDAGFSILTDIANDSWLCEFVATVEPRYFREVFTAGTAQEGEDLQCFLALLQELARA